MRAPSWSNWREKRLLFNFSSLIERDHFTLRHWRILSFWRPRVRPPGFFFVTERMRLFSAPHSQLLVIPRKLFHGWRKKPGSQAQDSDRKCLSVPQGDQEPGWDWDPEVGLAAEVVRCTLSSFRRREYRRLDVTDDHAIIEERDGSASQKTGGTKPCFAPGNRAEGQAKSRALDWRA